jgi:hypothetical protein
MMKKSGLPGLMIIFGIGLLLISSSCEDKREIKMSFGDDLNFLKKYTEIILLHDTSGKAMVAVSSAWQGRVMTSSSDGFDGTSYGWINRELIASQELQEHINVFGGEDRFWVGPEGGQFSVYFKAGAEFNLDNWYVPPEIDTEAFQTVSTRPDRAEFKRNMQLENYSGTQFNLCVNRVVNLESPAKALESLGSQLYNEMEAVAFSSVNAIKNTGITAWNKDTGLLSIWILGMFNPSPGSTIMIPYEEGPESKLGPMVNDAYFGKIPESRLQNKNGVLLFKADGNMRGKIGLSPRRSKSYLGSYDAENHILTIVRYTETGGTDYVNSMWEIQGEPYKGDVVNAYNDGPPEPGVPPLGPFYELETSSPAAELKPGESLEHTHTTFHIQGEESRISEIMMAVFGVNAEEVKGVFK